MRTGKFSKLKHHAHRTELARHDFKWKESDTYTLVALEYNNSPTLVSSCQQFTIMAEFDTGNNVG